MIEARATGMLDLLETLTCAGFAISEDGTVARCNARAEHLLGNGLQIVDGRLKAQLCKDCHAIDALIGELDKTQLLSRPAPEPIVIKREKGRPLILSIVRLGPDLGSSFGGLAAVLIADDLDCRPVPDKIVLSRLFGLSPAELLVAVRLAAGSSVEGCANELRLTEGTVRQLIKQVFVKSDTHRQSEFVALANRIVAARSGPPNNKN